MLVKTPLVLAVAFLSSLTVRAASVDSSQDEEKASCTMITVVAPVLPANQSVITKELVNHYVPTNLTPTNDPTLVEAQLQNGISQKIANDIIQGEMFRKSSVGKATTKVEKLSQTTMAISGNTKIDFQLKVVERQAMVTFTGGKLRSELIYAIDQSSIRWVISRPIGPSTNIAFTNTAPRDLSSISSVLSLTHSF